MCFSIGQKVVYLSEEGGGIIKDLSGNKFLVEDESGFDYWRYSHELAMVHKEEYGENVAVKDRSGIQTKAKVREENGWREIDLHIEELIDSHKHMSNTEIVNHQIAALRHFVEKARLDGIRRLLVIHGVCGSAKNIFPSVGIVGTKQKLMVNLCILNPLHFELFIDVVLP